MFKDREVAIQIRELTRNICALLTRGRDIVRNGNCTEAERNRYFQKIAVILADDMWQDIERQIFIEHPDLLLPDYGLEPEQL